MTTIQDLRGWILTILIIIATVVLLRYLLPEFDTMPESRSVAESTFLQNWRWVEIAGWIMLIAGVIAFAVSLTRWVDGGGTVGIVAAIVGGLVLAGFYGTVSAKQDGLSLPGSSTTIDWTKNFSSDVFVANATGTRKAMINDCVVSPDATHSIKGSYATWTPKSGVTSEIIVYYFPKKKGSCEAAYLAIQAALQAEKADE